MKTYTLITGATSGIGLELANYCSFKAHNLVLVGKSEIKLQKTRESILKINNSIDIQVVIADLSIPGSPDRIVHELDRKNISTGILINNAGFGKYGPFADSDWYNDLGMMMVNMVSLTHLTKLLLPQMLRRKEGKILNISSTAGFRSGPYMAVYFASKAYVLSFSEALSEELRGSGVSVTTLCPGATKSNFMDTAGLEVNQHLSFKKVASSKEVAQFGYNCLEKKKGVVVYGFMNRLILLLARFLPRRVLLFISRRIKEKKRVQ